MTKHARMRMHQRGITPTTTLACIVSGEKTPGYNDAERHHLLGFTVVTQQAGKGVKVLTVYEGHSSRHPR
ncbi:DUF4258 domain-containing protein [Pseudodesulfovibrio profundus]|uniref:DUF4258 domain-containing protein n=1 Tax=Pseudodesulfovibrio profundus TaxID=57320 RepID=UPI000BE3826F